MLSILVVAFVLSGAAGLIYESIWSRYLGLFVGHSAYAQIIVLVIFLGGMSLGAHLAGRRSERLRSPLLWYAAVEIAAGLLGLVFHALFVAITSAAYASIFPSLSGPWIIIVKWSIASLLVLPQSVVLGATFPLMSAGVIRVANAGESPGRFLALLYFANSLGAAGGVILAGFFLIAFAGLPGTIATAAIMNIVSASVVGLAGRSYQRTAAASKQPEIYGANIPADRSPYEGALLVVAFGTAVASFIYEIAWIRMLSLVLGSATHSFELMLSGFILGLAFGALWIRKRADRLKDPVRFLGCVQWAMGVLAIATLPLYIASFGWMAAVIDAVQQNDSGYRVFLVAQYAIGLLVMLPATFCAGMTLPLVTCILMRSAVGERAIGSVYAVNTLGSIAGVILAGLVLMPLLGLKLLLIGGGALDISLGIWLVAKFRRHERFDGGKTGLRHRFAVDRSLVFSVVVTAVLLLCIASIARFDLARLASGVYRFGKLMPSGSCTFLFYKDGRTATVSMRQDVNGFKTLATNGKPDASIDKWSMEKAPVTGNLRALTLDASTQILLPLITLAHAPGAQNVAVIGHGSGMSSHVLLGSPAAREVVTVEIEPEMIEASKDFQPANQRVFVDPRSTFVIDDAKSYFAASGRRFDLILSEPSNPWVSGVSGLFTLEFYQRVQRQLAPGGVFGQWLHLYDINDGLVTSVLSALDVAFPAYEIFFTSPADILVVASNTSLRKPDWNVVSYPGIAEDLQRRVPLTPALFEALRLGGRAELHPYLMTHGCPNSDYFPVLDLGAERTRFMHEGATGYMELGEGRFDVIAALSGRRAGFDSCTVAATPEMPRPVARSLGARIRILQDVKPETAATMLHNLNDERVRSVAFRRDQLGCMIGSHNPPTDWHAWMDSVCKADEDAHTGTAGVVDRAFFEKLRQYTVETNAPAEVRSSLDFLESIGNWDWPTAKLSARALMASGDRRPWLSDILVRNGAAVALIKLGDYNGARQVLEHFAARTHDDALRANILSAYIRYADSNEQEK